MRNMGFTDQEACIQARVAWKVACQNGASSWWDMGANLNGGPFGGHHLGGDSCPPSTLEVVPH